MSRPSLAQAVRSAKGRKRRATLTHLKKFFQEGSCQGMLIVGHITVEEEMLCTLLHRLEKQAVKKTRQGDLARAKSVILKELILTGIRMRYGHKIPYGAGVTIRGDGSICLLVGYHP